MMAETYPIEVGDHGRLVIVTSDKGMGKRPIKVGKGAFVVVADSTFIASLLLQTAEVAQQAVETLDKKLSPS
ncbi:hypothetical protein KKH05_00445 [Patescibacteria group bacterium]|nr:hypothetical protein [Patescibacteria group bacterium]